MLSHSLEEKKAQSCTDLLLNLTVRRKSQTGSCCVTSKSRMTVPNLLQHEVQIGSSFDSHPEITFIILTPSQTVLIPTK